MRTISVILSLWLFSLGALFSQSNPRLEVVAMFDANVLTLPAGNTEAVLANVQSTSEPIATALVKHGVSTVAKAFPRYSTADTLAIASTGEQVRLIDVSNIFVLKVADTSTVQKLIAALKNLPGVVYAEPNANDYRAHVLPNDPHFTNGDQWGLYNYGQNSGTSGADIHATAAWDITTGSNVLIGIIDDGVEATHDELTGKVGGDAGVYGGNANWAYGHGTHVSGIAAAVGSNSKGIAGVNWAATINSQRVENGSDAVFSNAITDAVNAGSKILSNSWGGNTFSTTIRIAFANAYKRNVVSVASMGNDNTSTPSYPAANGQGIIAVGATTNTDARASYSNYGSHIDVVAPGGANDGVDAHNIWSTFPGNTYISWAGTSMAAPFVSGIASLMFSINSSLSNDDIEQIIQLSADKVRTDLYTYDANGWNINMGYGRVNAKKALDFLRAPYTLTRTTATGGSIFQTQSHSGWFYGLTGAPDGYYIGNRHEVRKHVSFSSSNIPYFWGRGIATVGYALTNPGYNNYTMGYCEVVPGTLTTTGADVRTWVYEISMTNGTYYGWYPTRPENVVYGYTILSPSDVSLTAPIVANWNMTGIPDVVHDFAKTAVYPGALSTASRWDPNILPSGNYVAVDPLKNGEGYWVKFPATPPTVTHTGAPIYSMAMTVTNGAGSNWNLIGSISKSVATSSVVQTPPGIVTSNYFKYNGGYVVTTTLDPGLGFWVQVNASGTLTLSSTPPKVSGVDQLASLDRVTVKDANGGHQDLYVQNGSFVLLKGEGEGDGNMAMPPDPPFDIFNVRFQTGNFLQTIHPERGVTDIPIALKSVVYPLILEWDIHLENGIQFAFVTPNGRRIPLSGAGEMTLGPTNDKLVHLEASAGANSLRPTTYTLDQNYPNPFNPLTTIFYSLPESKHVRLVVYDMLGRDVGTLVDANQDAGYKSVSYDASHLPSGVYFYRLQAGNFVDLKKMILMK